MNRSALLLGVFVAAVAGVATHDRWGPTLDPYLARVARLIGRGGQEPALLGYLEARTTFVAPAAAGRLVSRAVDKGDRVAAGAALFALDLAQFDEQVRRAQASLAAAEARLANLRTGKREEEQEVVRAQRREAVATLVLAEQDLSRQTELLAKGVSARAAYDQAISLVNQTRARIASLEAQEKVGDLGGREAEIRAAEADAAVARASLAETQARRTDLAPASPVAGQVDDVFFDPGEWVSAGAAVVSIIADDALRVRFFVPEARLAEVRPGTTVAYACDSCPAGLTARVSFVSAQAEYTPPVIYSTGARAKLVFMVEAVPDERGRALRPGLPVEVRLEKGAGG